MDAEASVTQSVLNLITDGFTRSSRLLQRQKEIRGGGSGQMDMLRLSTAVVNSVV